MIRSLFLDLDDTLLLNDMQVFIPEYYRALVAKVSPVCDAATFVEAMKLGTRAMFDNDGRCSNAQIFDEVFFETANCARDTIMPLFDAFYATEYEQMSAYTEPDPHAKRVVDAAFARGLQVVIATQPVFPRSATLARLRWAGVGAETYPYAIITSYEELGVCKPHPLYFRTLLERLERPAYECLMVGDNLEADMPARALGLRTFFVNRQRRPAPAGLCDAQGSMADLARMIESGGIDAL